MDLSPLYLFYDPGCPLCRRFKYLLEQWDRQGQVRALALDAPELPRLFPWLDPEVLRRQLTVCDPEGRLAQGAEALRRLAEVLPGVRRLTWACRLPGVSPAVNALYRTAHRYRKRLCLRCGEKWMPSHKYSQRQRPR